MGKPITTKTTVPSKTEHIPIMRTEVLALLQPQKTQQPMDRKINNMTVIDCTLGTGGHTFALLDKLTNSTVLSIDLDEEQIDYVFDKAIKRGFKVEGTGKPHESLWGWKMKDKNGNILNLVKSNFMFCGDNAKKVGITHADLVLFDLGFSTYQLKEAKRGLSYEEDTDELLDQRYSLSDGWKATDIINMLNEKELSGLLKEYGEERKAKEIAKAIVMARKAEPIETNTQLSTLIRKAVGSSYEPGKHPAMRTFQALRIAVNNELVSLASALPQAFDLIAGGSEKKSGKVAVITFNTLEQRILGKLLKSDKTLKLTDEIRPGVTEVALNPRSHSAILYVLEKVSV